MLLIIDGQGGGIGRALIEQIKRISPECELTAVGTNAIATSAMLRAGADKGATGENAVKVCAAKAKIIAGPIGLLMADAMLGEITPAMSAAIGASDAHKVLVPSARCGVQIAGMQTLPPLNSLIEDAAAKILALV